MHKQFIIFWRFFPLSVNTFPIVLTDTFPGTFLKLFVSPELTFPCQFSIFFFIFQVLKSVGILEENGKLAWSADPEETKRFKNKWESALKYYENNIRRQEKRPPKNYDLAGHKRNLDVPFLCPSLYSNIFRQFDHKKPPRAVQQET